MKETVKRKVATGMQSNLFPLCKQEDKIAPSFNRQP
jgi:hypothetical protein